MRTIQRRSVRIYGRPYGPHFGAAKPGRGETSSLERRDQGTDRCGILFAGRGRVGSGKSAWPLAAASVRLAQGSANRLAEAAGRGDVGGGGRGLAYHYDPACVLFVKPPGCVSDRPPRPKA